MAFLDIETVNSTIDVEDQQGNRMDWRIEVRPPSDPHVTSVESASDQKAWEAIRKNKNVAKVQSEASARKLAAHIADWHWGDNPTLTTAEGRVISITPKDYSEQAAVELMKDRNFAFVHEQIAEEVNNAANFYKA